MDLKAIFTSLQATDRGLSAPQAANRLAEYGPNILPEQGATPVWLIVLRQFINPLIYILVIAAVVCVMIGDIKDAAFIGLLTLRGDRLDVWRNSLALVSDYPFTGLGLGNFEMAYSTYVLLVQVGHTRHAHNLYLDIWIQQGLLGLFAFGWLTVAAARSQVNGPLGLAAPASLAVMLLHGLVDDPFYGYGGRGVLLIFVPFALLARTRLPEIIPGNEQPARSSRRSLVLWIILGVTLLAMLPLRSTRAALQANLAAVAQTKAELSVYRWPEWAMQDAVGSSCR